ncbi:MAG: threonylcarbamoyl-AMP synthase [Spirochaetia bacterium]|nr:threonylcarbamoyl-AMP synthase [Spirochaetia bacterium]
MKLVTVKAIIDILNKDGVVILPTDTVYGLFCRAYSKKAVSKIYSIKGRAKHKPLQVFVRSKDEIYALAKAGPKQKRLIDEMLPGRRTVILALKPGMKKRFPFLKKNTLGFRIIRSADINHILRHLGEPLAATSANKSGEPSPIKFRDISKNIIKKSDFSMMNDKMIKGKPSTVADITGKDIKILRK